ncbi:MAG: DUF2029 domain-containing protein [Actinobacteria bacterium]|nr:DUF2029 domain-containing protein [Actinomycetota bacterium]
MVALAAGYALKAQCLAAEPWAGQQYERLCYNDIQPLYESRAIATHTFPYIYAYLGEDGLKGGGIEYPVLTGLFMWAMGFLADDPNGYLQATAVVLAAVALFVAWLLYRMSGARAFYWAAAPTLALYAFHNWDVLVVAAAVGALYMWWTGRYTGAAILIGIGGALKLYPLLFMVPLFLDAWARGDRRRARRSVAWGLGTLLVVNLPIMYANPPSWWLTYRFHRLRGPNVDSLWYQAFPDLQPSTINLLSAVLTVATIGAVSWWCVTRYRRDGVFPFVQASAAVTAAFLVWSKVQSPQYMLWLLPFFALLRVRPLWWVAFTVLDVIAYAGVFRYFHGVSTGSQYDVAAYAMVFSVLARAALWSALVVVFARAEPARPPERVAMKLSHPVPRLTASES